VPTTSNPDAQRRNPAARPLAVLLVLALAAASWWLIETGVRVGHLVQWECWGGECSTDDWRALLPVAGIICNVILAVMLGALARLFGVGLAAVLGTYAAISGWNTAVAEDGLAAATVATELRVVGAAFGVAAVLALLGLLIELKTTGYGARLLGAQRVRATLTGFGIADAPIGNYTPEQALEHGFGQATLHFTHSGSRHAVKVRVRRVWLDEPVYAVFREMRPENARVVRPWFRSSTAVEKTAPATATGAASTASTAPTSGGSGSIVSELERLAALRSAGHLTQEEFDRAKGRLLGE
jgi:hypothetical protein